MAAKKLSVSELQALIRNAKSEIEKRQKRLDRVKSKVDTILKNEGVTLDDLCKRFISKDKILFT